MLISAKKGKATRRPLSRLIAAMPEQCRRVDR